MRTDIKQPLQKQGVPKEQFRNKLYIHVVLIKNYHTKSYSQKSYRPGNLRKTACPKKHLAQKVFFFIFLYS